MISEKKTAAVRFIFKIKTRRIIESLKTREVTIQHNKPAGMNTLCL